MSLSKQEREHIVRWSDDPSEGMSVFTHRRSVAERLLQNGAQLRFANVVDGKTVSWQIECPVEWVRWPIPRKRRQIPQANRDAASARLAAARAAKAAK